MHAKVLVMDPMDLFDDNFNNFDFGDNNKMDFDFSNSHDKSFFSDTSLQSLEEEKDTSEDVSSSKSSTSKKKKRERNENVQLPLGKDAVLPKEVELEIDQLEVFEDYVQRLKGSRTLTKEEKSGLTQQRKRVRNRLYAIQKRQKEKETKAMEQNLVSKLQAENENLKREILSLREENQKLKSALNSNGVPFRTGGFTLLALVVTFSFFFSPITNHWSSSHSGTGRVLMSSNVQDKWSSPSNLIRYSSSAVYSLLYSNQKQAPAFDPTGFDPPKNYISEGNGLWWD